MTDIETRLASLERANRRMKLFIAALATMLASVFLLGMDRQIPDNVQAKSFEVVNDAGKVVVRINTLAGQGAVSTLNEDGQYLVDIVAAQSGAGGIVVYDGKGKKNLVVTDVNGGGGSLLVNNAEGAKVVSLGRNTVQGGSITLSNAKGSSSILATSDTDGAGVIQMYDREGKERSRIP